MRTGLSRQACANIAEKVSRDLRNGDKTRDIYRKAFSLIKENSRVASVHYSLKKSLLELGPEGHYFEDYVARFFEQSGFQATVCKVLRGKYVRHEVDCIAEKDNKKFFSECKFHNRAGAKNDVKVTLYVKARWDDLRDGPDGKDLQGFYLFSNTAFTSDALTYAKGTGLKLMGVNAPDGSSFLDIIKEMKLYPVTSLRSLSSSQKNQLLDRKLILARELTEEILYKLGMDSAKVTKVTDELKIMFGEHI